MGVPGQVLWVVVQPWLAGQAVKQVNGSAHMEPGLQAALFGHVPPQVDPSEQVPVQAVPSAQRAGQAKFGQVPVHRVPLAQFRTGTWHSVRFGSLWIAVTLGTGEIPASEANWLTSPSKKPSPPTRPMTWSWPFSVLDAQEA